MKQMTLTIQNGKLAQKHTHRERLANAKPNSLAVKRPDLLEEWDWEKNDELGLDPYVLSCGSCKTAHWKCSVHPEGYDTRIGRRTSPSHQGCPFCSGNLKRLVVGFNDLESQYPKIAAEWDYEKNGDVKPSEVFKASNKKYWWICPIHGSYEMTVAGRTNQGSGCKACGRERTRLARIKPRDDESLAEKCPDIAQQWHPYLNGTLTPSDVRFRSSKKAWWLGECGHEWEAVIDSRVDGKGCPFCAGKAVLTGFNDLATIAPDVAAEWHPTKNGELTPSTVLAGTHKVVWWLGECKHEWRAQIKNRVANHTGCPECYKGRQVSFSEKALFFYVSRIYRDAVQNYKFDDGTLGRNELDIWIPSLGTGIEFDGYYWHNKNPERDAMKDKLCLDNGIKLIRVREHGCIAYDGCTATIIQLEDNYKEEALNRAIAKLIEELGCDDIYYIDAERDRREITELIKTDAVNRSLSEVHPEIASQWHPTMNGSLTPDMFSYGSKYPAWWICPKGHEPYQTSIAVRSRGHGCPKCKGEAARAARLKPKPGHSLRERFPELAEEWHPTKNGDLTPDNVSYGSRTQKVWWVCPEGHEDYQMLPNRRTSGARQGCPVCAQLKRSSGRKP